MLLSLLSDTFVSDSIDDAGRVGLGRPYRSEAPVHFPALCRGLAVLVALALPVVLTIIGNAAPYDADAGFDTQPPARIVSGADGR